MNQEINVGTISGMTITEAIDYLIDQLLENKIGSEGKYDGLISGDITLGNYVDMGGYTWRVCHIDEEAGEFYLILNTVTEKYQFSEHSIDTYANSDIIDKCRAFLNTLPAEVINILLSKKINGVTAKAFIPSYEQVNGGFGLFNSNNNRIAYDSAGAHITWWTSTADSSGGIWIVKTNGTFGSYNTLDSLLGFRPCVCIALL